jgi:phage terminase small subunit
MRILSVDKEKPESAAVVPAKKKPPIKKARKKSEWTPNPNQRRFIKYYIETGNATESAKRAGYSAKTAYSIGQRLLKDVEIKRKIEKTLEKHGLTDDVLAEELRKGVLDSKETKFFTHQGEVVETEEVIPWAIRHKYLELAFKVKKHLRDAPAVEVNDSQINIQIVKQGAPEEG